MHHFFAAFALALAASPAPTAAALRAAAVQAPAATVRVPSSFAAAELTVALPGEALVERPIPAGLISLRLDEARRADLDGDGRLEVVALARERLCPTDAGQACQETTRLMVFTGRASALLTLAAAHTFPAEGQVDGFDVADGEITVYRAMPTAGADPDERFITFIEEPFTFDGRRLAPTGEPWFQVYDPADGC